jgi:hypothetical protein
VFSQKKFKFCVQAYSPPYRSYCLDPFSEVHGGREGIRDGRRAAWPPTGHRVACAVTCSRATWPTYAHKRISQVGPNVSIEGG